MGFNKKFKPSFVLKIVVRCNASELQLFMIPKELLLNAALQKLGGGVTDLRLKQKFMPARNSKKHTDLPLYCLCFFSCLGGWSQSQSLSHCSAQGEKKCHRKWMSSWWFQPISKICSSNWIISPRFGAKIKKCLSCHHLEMS